MADDKKLSDEEKRRATAAISIAEENIDTRTRQDGITHNYGICNKCSHFSIRKTSLYDEEAHCCYDYDRRFKTKPTKHNPISFCTEFFEAGVMTLRDMRQIALILDLVPIDQKAGFNPDADKPTPQKLIIGANPYKDYY